MFDSPARSMSTSAALLAAVVTMACSAYDGDRIARLSPADPGVVSRSEIEESGARTAWEALRLTVALHLEEDVYGNPSQILHRGHGSILGPQAPILVVDGAIVSDFNDLDEMPAGDLAQIRVRSRSAATAEYGALASAGVIELTTRRW